MRLFATLILGLLMVSSFTATAVCGQDVSADSLPPLFSSHEVLQLTLEADFRQLRGDRSQDTEYRPGRISFDQPDGSTRTLDVGVKTRGIFRLRRNVCRFPPLRLNFRTREAAETVFAGQDKLKLVVHCQDHSDEYEQYVLREYLAYRIYASLTPFSFRVRLARITYIQTGATDSLTKFAFFIEDEDRLARRTGGTIVDSAGVSQMALDEEHAALFAIFQYFAGNTDWKVSVGHNVKLLQRGQRFPVAVPYDLDWSGVVDAPYAVPDPDLNISDVTQRVFISPCLTQYDLDRVLTMFRVHKTEIYGLIQGQEGLDQRSREQTLEYFEQFYRCLDDPRCVRREFVRGCPGG